MNVAVGTLTQPGSTGNQTYSLAANFDPKAILLWTTPSTADEAADADANFCMGGATYRGSAAQQAYAGYYSKNAVASADCALGSNTNAVLKLWAAATSGTIDMEVAFVSFATGASSNFVLNWVNLHTTASIRVHYMAFGGSDITDALLHTFNLSTAVATQDVTVATGFGQPDLLMWMKSGRPTFTGEAQADARPLFSAAKSATERFSATLFDDDGNSVMTMTGWQKARALATVESNTGSVADAEADLSAKASWPADGYQFSYSDQAAVSATVIGLALKGTFTSTVGTTDSPTSTGSVTYDHGSPPSGALLFAVSGVGTNTTLVTDNAALGVFGVGALDGTNEAYAGAGNDDNDGTSDTARVNSTTKVMQIVSPDGTPTVLAEADGAISGNNISLDWTTVDSVAHRVGIVSFGSAAAVATGIPYLVTARRN